MSAEQRLMTGQPDARLMDPPMDPEAFLTTREPRFVRSGAPSSEYLSSDPEGSIVELARMADRVMQARDQVHVERHRADIAEREADALRDRLATVRVLVHEAQDTARLSAERVAFMEGRCEALEGALDRAITAPVWTRWRWRRSMKTS